MSDDFGPDWSGVGKELPDDYFRQPSPARVWNYWLGGKDNAAQAPPQVDAFGRVARKP